MILTILDILILKKESKSETNYMYTSLHALQLWDRNEKISSEIKKKKTAWFGRWRRISTCLLKHSESQGRHHPLPECDFKERGETVPRRGGMPVLESRARPRMSLSGLWTVAAPSLQCPLGLWGVTGVCSTCIQDRKSHADWWTDSPSAQSKTLVLLRRLGVASWSGGSSDL